MTRRVAAVAVVLGVSLAGGFPALAQQQYRTEHDLLGDKQVPADAYYGIQTALSPFSVVRFPSSVLRCS